MEFSYNSKCENFLKKSKFKAFKIVKMAFDLLKSAKIDFMWNHSSRKIAIHSVEYPKSKFPIRLPRSVLTIVMLKVAKKIFASKNRLLDIKNINAFMYSWHLTVIFLFLKVLLLFWVKGCVKFWSLFRTKSGLENKTLDLWTFPVCVWCTEK